MAKKSILIVEDSESLVEAYKLFFGDLGIDVASAGNLEDALSIARERIFDFYITDGEYPQRKDERPSLMAFNFYDEIKKINPNARIILHCFADLGEEAHSLGMDYINKCDKDRIKKIVELIG